MDNYFYEMGYTPSEFKKTLQGQFTLNTQYSCEEVSSGHWLVSLDDKSMTVVIQVEKTTPRKIAMLTLPVLSTNFQFNNASETQQKEFLQTFFRYFHKGGG